jgi:hypothetical protein
VTAARTKQAPSPDLYLIEWLDPRAHFDGEPSELDAARVRTVGWLTHESRDRLVISQELVNDEHASASTVWRGSTVVMKSLVVSRTKLAPGKGGSK